MFGLFFVGIVGLGATAGILAVAAHSAGTLGKLLAEAIETLDTQPVDAVRPAGATGAGVLPRCGQPCCRNTCRQVLYVWEFNIRDSTIAGWWGRRSQVAAVGGDGAVSVGRLATLLIAIVIMVLRSTR